MKDWKKEKIGDNFLVTDYVANGSFASLSENVTYINTPDYAILVRTTDNTKKWNGNYVYVNKNSFDFLKKSRLFLDDLIIANVGDPGKAFLCPDLKQPMTLGPNSILVRPLDKNKIFNKYFYYYTTSKIGQCQIQDICSATAQKKFNKTSYRGLDFSFPPLPQQQKIAKILDATDELRQNDKKIIAKYDELTQVLFLDMFGDPVSNPKGWEKVSGKIVFKLVGGAAFKSSDYSSTGLPLIRIGTVNKAYFDNSQLAFLPKSFENTHSRYIVYPNDLLITLTGTVGKDDYGNAFALTYEYEKYLLNQRVAKICSSDNYNLVFLKFFLKQKKVKNELIGVSRGVRQANLSNEDFYKLEVINPSIDLQNQFAERVALIEEQKAIAQKSLEKSEVLFNSLLQKAFKGELV